jgi:hypothetical protein
MVRARPKARGGQAPPYPETGRALQERLYLPASEPFEYFLVDSGYVLPQR